MLILNDDKVVNNKVDISVLVQSCLNRSISHFHVLNFHIITNTNLI